VSARPASRTLLGWCAIIAIVLTVTEGASWLALSWLQKRWVSYGTLRHAMLAVVGSTDETPAPSGALPTSEEYVHPYFGVSYPVRDRQNRRGHGLEQLADYGFKEDAGPLVTARDPQRVVIDVTGGSVARGFLDHGGRDALAEELKRYPAFKDKEIVFSCTAFYGHKEPQELLAITYLLSLGAVFDVIVSLDGFNEIAEGKVYNETAGASPFYPWGWHGRLWKLATTPAALALHGEIASLRQRRSQAARWVLGMSRARSMSVAFLWSTFDRRWSGRINQLLEQLATQSQPDWSTVLDSGPLPQYADDEGYLRDQVSIWRESTRQLARLSKANGIRFFSILQPNQYAGHHIMTAQEKKLAWNARSPFKALVEKGYPLLRAAGRQLQDEEQVPYDDASDVFDATRRSIYTDDCCHFGSVQGNRLLAQRVAQVLARGTQ